MKIRDYWVRRPFGAPAEIRECRVREVPDGPVPEGAVQVPDDTPEHDFRPVEEGE